MQELTSHCPTPDTFNADGTKQAVDQGIEDGERVRKYEELCILSIQYGLFNFSVLISSGSHFTLTYEIQV